MSQDISKVLSGWEYEPDQISVRIVPGDDGKEKIQLRLDLGLLQMEMDGRPDGVRPEGAESWLDYYQAQQHAQEDAHPDGKPFGLTSDDCQRLLREGIQYYHRYISFWHLERYDLCARDTARNLGLFKFVRGYAEDERDKLQFDQFRPYVTMMHTRAVATPMVNQRRYAEALAAIDEGLAGIRDFLAEYQQQHRANDCVELVQLEHWREEIVGLQNSTLLQPPVDPLERLRRQLRDAVAAERFEEAARLRDEIRLRQAPSTPLRPEGQM